MPASGITRFDIVCIIIHENAQKIKRYFSVIL